MKNHIMVDLETMGLSSNTAILSIGACVFNPFKWETPAKNEIFEINVDLQDCINAGLKVDASTLFWWMKQSKAAQDRLLQRPFLLNTALYEFSQFFKGVGNYDRGVADRGVFAWGHGAAFDIPILENAFSTPTIGNKPKLILDVPWRFANVRDTRTIFDLASVRVDHSKGTAHVAVHDAINQARTVCEAYKILKIKEREEL